MTRTTFLILHPHSTLYSADADHQVVIAELLAALTAHVTDGVLGHLSAGMAPEPVHRRWERWSCVRDSSQRDQGYGNHYHLLQHDYFSFILNQSSLVWISWLSRQDLPSCLQMAWTR